MTDFARKTHKGNEHKVKLDGRAVNALFDIRGFLKAMPHMTTKEVEDRRRHFIALIGMITGVE